MEVWKNITMHLSKFKYTRFLLLWIMQNIICQSSCLNRARTGIRAKTVSTNMCGVARFLHPTFSYEFWSTVLEESLNYLFILLEKITVLNYCHLERWSKSKQIKGAGQSYYRGVIGQLIKNNIRVSFWIFWYLRHLSTFKNLQLCCDFSHS